MRLLKKLERIADRALRLIVLSLIAIYRLVFSPTNGILRHLPFYFRPSCIFYPTCSEYAKACFEKYPFRRALIRSVRRIGRCHPGNDPTVDLP